MQIAISLNYEQMESSKLVYQGKVLTRPKDKVSEIFSPSEHVVNEVTVVPKDDMEKIMSSASHSYDKYSKKANDNPKVVGAAISALILLILFLMA